MPHDVTMPQLGMTQDAGKIVSWLKAPGDPVAKGDALFEVETDKATMEVEAQANGFLSHVSAAEGDDVSVGVVIARISDSADEDVPAALVAKPKAQDDELPEGLSITMPQLGMAQDTGLLVSWHKELGDAVATDDVLFEVETDKSTIEVPAGADGYLAATLADAGQEVPVGDAVAIISNYKPNAPISRSAAAPTSAMAPASPPTPPKAQSSARPVPSKQSWTTTNGRVLASPKARRLALEQGLDLDKLARSGHPQPFHVSDLEAARALPTGIAATKASQTYRLTAEVVEDGLPNFAAWAAQAHRLTDATAILAGLAGAGLNTDNISATVAIERLGQTHTYRVPQGRALSQTTVTDETAPDLILRDLRGTPIRQADLGSQSAPVLTLMNARTGLTITLECAPDQLDAQSAITLLTNFAGRMEQPLRHLL
jgi:pyruvate/2-oxoglutarate dehydrogenase complex dihydrolipoamide acyltransferase (E2) component